MVRRLRQPASSGRKETVIPKGALTAFQINPGILKTGKTPPEREAFLNARKHRSSVCKSVDQLLPIPAFQPVIVGCHTVRIAIWQIIRVRNHT